ncbi:MAG: DUF4292 domain-containing protein [Bacteroidia bacterium]|nr:DUF4292 domain-containing protein [Bacteroidia bacterium]
MKNGKTVFAFLLLSLVVFGCKNRKPKGDCSARLIKLPNNYSEQIQENLASYGDVSIRVKANYKGGNSDQSFGMRLKMRKDSFVWVSVDVVIEVARAYITADSFKLIDRINKKYYIGTIDKLEEFIGQRLSLRQLQDMLLANPVYALAGFQQMNDELRNDFLQSVQTGIVNRMQLTQCYRPVESEFTTSLNERSVVVDYKNFTKHKDIGMIPYSVNVSGKDSARGFDLHMEYSSVSSEPLENVRFIIPSKYEKGN